MDDLGNGLGELAGLAEDRLVLRDEAAAAQREEGEEARRDQDLLDAVEVGLVRDRTRREREELLRSLRERFDSLSSREREIMGEVAAGRLNKQIANDIGISESTVKVHRTHLMRKMKARSLPELSRMADMLKMVSGQP